MATITITSPVLPAAGTGASRATRRATAYQQGLRRADRTLRCPNRNGFWPPLYERHYDPLPPRRQPSTAQAQWERCVRDAVEAGELHRTTGVVLLAFSRHSDNWHNDVTCAQATVAAKTHLAESTVCHHIATAKQAGWVMVQHRNRLDRGEVLAMSNITRFLLPQPWQDRLDQQADARRERRRNERSSAPGRHTPKHRHAPDGNTGGGQPGPWTPSMHAANAGAAEARSAADFETGRQALATEYHGRPALYEAAYDSFSETWRTVRINQ